MKAASHNTDFRGTSRCQETSNVRFPPERLFRLTHAFECGLGGRQVSTLWRISEKTNLKKESVTWLMVSKLSIYEIIWLPCSWAEVRQRVHGRTRLLPPWHWESRGQKRAGTGYPSRAYPSDVPFQLGPLLVSISSKDAIKLF